MPVYPITVAGLQRDLHTLKGGARMAGLTPIGDLSHAMESLLEAIHAGSRRMDRAAIESFERGFDRLLELCRQMHVPGVETGRFGAHMVISLVNDGPVTIRRRIAPAATV